VRTPQPPPRIGGGRRKSRDKETHRTDKTPAITRPELVTCEAFEWRSLSWNVVSLTALYYGMMKRDVERGGRSVGVPPAVSGASRSRQEGAGRMATAQRAGRPRYVRGTGILF
jgi:hypothetical protein